jgi:very-short-patch-repair endonuclease
MGIEGEVRADIHGELPTRSVDAAIAGLAARQHGVVTRTQLTALGLGRGAIDHRVAIRRLHLVHRGVFAVGHSVLSRPGRWLAAVLAAGPEAALSHRSAAALWGIRESAAASVDVTAPRQCKRPGIRTHRVVLRADEVTVHHGIPVTTPARTLLDLAAVLRPHQLERAVHETEYRRLTSPLSLDALLARHPRRRGTRALQTIVDRGNLGRTLTRSDFEIEFLAFLDAHALPRPLTNEPIGPYTVDAVWPAQRLVVELDSRQAHETARAFEQDRARDRHLLVRGYRVARITYRQLQDEQPTLAAELRALLETAAA